MANTIAGLTLAQLRRVIDIKEKMEALERELAAVTGSAPAVPAAPPAPTAPAVVTTGAVKKRRLSAAGRAAIIKAAKLRWARQKSGQPAKVTAPVAVAAKAPKKRKLSAEGRARIIAAAKARWAKVNAAKKK